MTEKHQFVFFAYNNKKIAQFMPIDFMCVLGQTFRSQPGISQLCLNLCLLLVESFKVSQR